MRPWIAALVIAGFLGGVAAWLWTARVRPAPRPFPPPSVVRAPGGVARLPDPGTAPREDGGLERTVPRTLDEYLSLLGRLRGRGGDFARWARRFEEAMVADAELLSGFVSALEARGERRGLCVALLSEFSAGFLARPEVVRVALLVAMDEEADPADRAAILAHELPCWGAEDPRAWDTLARLAQSSRDERVRDAAEARLEASFREDARTKRLLAERWRREADPASRATGLASALEALDGTGKADLIAMAASVDASPEVREVAAAQVLADVLGGSERPMTADQRATCCKALLPALTPTEPLATRRPIVAAVLAGGSVDQVRALSAYLEGQEPDATLRTWGLDLAGRILAAGGARGDDVMQSLVGGLEPDRR